MKTEQVLKRLDTAWKDFEDSYAGLSDSQLMIPNVTGAWSVRDIIAHVTVWEEEALMYMPVIQEGGRPPRYSTKYGGINVFNALMTEQTRHLSLADVLGRHDDVHAQLIEYVRDAPEELFTGEKESRFRRRLRQDTYGHYPIHARAIRKWRAQSLGPQ